MGQRINVIEGVIRLRMSFLAIIKAIKRDDQRSKDAVRAIIRLLVREARYQ